MPLCLERIPVQLARLRASGEWTGGTSLRSDRSCIAKDFLRRRFYRRCKGGIGRRCIGEFAGFCPSLGCSWGSMGLGNGVAAPRRASFFLLYEERCARWTEASRGTSEEPTECRWQPSKHSWSSALRPDTQGGKRVCLWTVSWPQVLCAQLCGRPACRRRSAPFEVLSAANRATAAASCRDATDQAALAP